MPWGSTIFLPFFSLIRFWIFFRNDFYLVPMSVNLGTVNPTHYIVTDAGSIEIDLIQKVAYALSHMYFNWTGTVKIPAPCQYARKLGKWKKWYFVFKIVPIYCEKKKSIDREKLLQVRGWRLRILRSLKVSKFHNVVWHNKVQSLQYLVHVLAEPMTS